MDPKKIEKQKMVNGDYLSGILVQKIQKICGQMLVIIQFYMGQDIQAM